MLLQEIGLPRRVTAPAAAVQLHGEPENNMPLNCRLQLSCFLVEFLKQMHHYFYLPLFLARMSDVHTFEDLCNWADDELFI